MNVGVLIMNDTMIRVSDQSVEIQAKLPPFSPLLLLFLSSIIVEFYCSEETSVTYIAFV